MFICLNFTAKLSKVSRTIFLCVDFMWKPKLTFEWNALRFPLEILKNGSVYPFNFTWFTTCIWHFVVSKRFFPIYILSKKYRELIIQKARLQRWSKTFLTLSWYHCPLYWDVEFERDLSFSSLTVLDVVSLSQVCLAIFLMDKNMESLKMLQKAYGESTLSKTVDLWWKICLALIGHQRL